MFNAPNTAAGFGHVGWAFEAGNNGQWVFGSTDDAFAGGLSHDGWGPITSL